MCISYINFSYMWNVCCIDGCCDKLKHVSCAFAMHSAKLGIIIDLLECILHAMTACAHYKIQVAEKWSSNGAKLTFCTIGLCQHNLNIAD